MQVSERMVRDLSEVAGIAIPIEDLPILADALSRHLEAFRAVDEMELGDVDQAPVFDARWHV
jgi:hypothetical protein